MPSFFAVLFLILIGQIEMCIRDRPWTENFNPVLVD